MKHSTTWRAIVSRAFFVLVLLVPLGITAPRAEIVEAALASVPIQQTDVPIDTSVPGEPIPAPENPYENLVGVVGGPDETQRIQNENQPIKESLAEVIPEFHQQPDPDAPLDMTLPENIGLTPSPVAVPEQVPAAPPAAEPALDLTFSLPVSGVTGANEAQAISGLTGNLDDFDRADGPLGEAWTDKATGITIFNSLARTTPGGLDTALSIHNGIGVNEAKARISISGAGFTKYSGFAFNYADGQDFIFIKIQDNDQNGWFDTGACYTGNNNLIYFGLGFFDLSGTFTQATLHVSVKPNRSVEISLTDLAGGGANQKYVCSGAPAVNGTQFGIVSYGGGQIDNVTVETADPEPFTSFGVQDGPLGSDWHVKAGSFEVQQQKALGRAYIPNLATYNSLGANQIEADVSLAPGGGVQYAGLVLNYDEGVNDLFMKVQDGNGDGTFDKGACYTGNNNSSASFGLNYFNLDYPFSRAHMTVMVNNNREVYFRLTNIDGGSGSQYYICAGAPAAEGYGVGIASFNSGRVDNFQVVQDFQDNFNREDGSLGTDWAVLDGSYAIVNQKAVGIEGWARAVYNGMGASQIEADVSLSPTAAYQYSALMLDYGTGTQNLFIKVQDNGGAGYFDTAACYLGNSDIASSFGLGFFYLDHEFTTAHMIVRVDEARVVTLVFTNIDGGSGTQAYVCAGAPAAEGPFVGIGSKGGGKIDNVRVNRVFGLDAFNRPTGSLGPSWETKSGLMGIVDQTARGLISDSNLTLFTNVTGNQVEGNIAVNPNGAINFAAFILNYGAGDNNIFIKFQNQDDDPGFEMIGCYLGNNGTGGTFGFGYGYMTAQVLSAHVKIWVDQARTVTILLTRINGDTGMQLYTCAGAPPAEGELVGIASFNEARLDNVMASDFVPTLDAFLPMIIR